jgi:hypothetical protein
MPFFSLKKNNNKEKNIYVKNGIERRIIFKNENLNNINEK